MSIPSKPSILLPRSNDDRIFSHFTNAEGIQGITGIDAANLQIGQQVFIKELKFGLGVNSFLSSAPGQIFVTELGIDATEGQLMNIGIFGNKQNFAIQFSEQEAFLNNGVRVIGQMPSRSIYTIPGDTTLEGEFLVIRIR